ncbi:MAG: terpene cyclase/mutase family protein [Cryomorphaceae bacterium]|nr:terpene cyclase/mutase family protein [Cryomorphaceae bacterium]
MRTIRFYLRKLITFLGKPLARRLISAERKRLNQKAFPTTPDYAQLKQSAQLAQKWLLHAQQQSPDGGFPTYDLAEGFGASYPETSGYILDSLLTYQSRFPSHILQKSVEDATNWLLEIQHPEGGWQSGYVNENKPPIVFNTGQVMRGLIHYFTLTRDERLGKSLDAAAQWIVNVQESEGYWAKHNFLGLPRVYDTYVAAPLARWAKIRDREDWVKSAQKNINWVLGKQKQNGWFYDADNTVKHNDRPILHTIAYTVDGLIEFFEITGDQRALEAGIRAAEVLAKMTLDNPKLPGRFDGEWKGSEATILTGCAQMSIVWGRLIKIQPEMEIWKDAKNQMDAFLIFAQWKSESMPDLQGALTGSFPFWGKYEPFRCPNWAVKYFLDAMMSNPTFEKNRYG